jgi:hypothetical protein
MGAEAVTKIANCRVCHGDNLLSVLDLGSQFLTGVFPRSREEAVVRGPLELLWCSDCNLLQLAHSYAPNLMYGENYGYRSGLNPSMIRHLTRKVHYLERIADLQSGDTVIDIGSNDGTALKAYTRPDIRRLGIDPTARKFANFYPPEIILIPEFFSAERIRKAGIDKARIITSIAMFYDLEDPITFAREIGEPLASDGIWHFEQSYMPSMLRTGSYDTVCHEHVEYYCMSTIKYILDRADLDVLDVKMNAVNGGSFAVTAVKKSPRGGTRNNIIVDWLIEQELRMGLNTPRPFRDFEERVYRHRADLRRLLAACISAGSSIVGYGASTKGNVLLQFCGITTDQVGAIAEVNADKFGAFTPGTLIPIISEADAHAMNPDYLLVLPWHFKEGILTREENYLNKGGKIIFPPPEIEIV